MGTTAISASTTESLASADLSGDVAAVARIDAVPKILEIVSRVTGMGFAAIARVTEDRWMACAVRDEINFGLQPGGELELETTICNEIRQSGKLVVIDHVSEDDDFCSHPTPAKYGFQSYISVPILRPDGAFFGTLCAIDPRPARVNTPETVGMFRMFADLIGFHLDAQDRLADSEAALLDARQTAELRDQFIAVLGHDLRNPLSSVDAGMKLLARTSLDGQATKVVGMVGKSVTRMVGLVENILDFARGRLGGGIPVERAADSRLGDALAHVITELRTVWSERTIEVDLVLDRPIYCDSGRIAQLLSNLLANALTHGDPAAPVQVTGLTRDGFFELSVTNSGAPIPADVRGNLFQPFKRMATRSGEQGLGLGLFIASEIARAHDATLECQSDSGKTRFTLRMPAASAVGLGARRSS